MWKAARAPVAIAIMEDDPAGFVGKDTGVVAGQYLDADMLVEREQIVIIAVAEYPQRDVDPAGDAVADVIDAMRAHSGPRLAFENRDPIFVLEQIGRAKSGNTSADDGEPGFIPVIAVCYHQA